MPRRTSPLRPPAAPPANAAEGAAYVRAFMVELFARKDGEAVNWKLMTDTLFRAGFDMLDKLPDDVRRSVARRVHEGSYGRMLDALSADSGASKTGPAESVSELANIAGLKSPDPGPGKPH